MTKKFSLAILSIFFFVLCSCNHEEIDFSEIRDTLEQVYINDQIHRLKLDSINNTCGQNSKEMDSLWKVINKTDSVNLSIVTHFLDKYGWVGSKDIGAKSNLALFLVIQHSNLQTQLKYYKMLKKAVRKGNADKMDFAYLDDRIAVRQGKPQKYGTQLILDTVKNVYYVFPLKNPDKVDKWRKKIGIPPMQTYFEIFNQDWDIEEYKKQLPKIKELAEKYR
ncbi:MAG: hypothetical protein JXR68_07205 [Bacteroidales bacterium]|nr:hypothetical protein [Bacteroidales bacterium]